jgi:hypothetical protein
LSKVICSEAIARVADRSLQILGGLGITRDTVVERIFRLPDLRRAERGPSLGAGGADRRREDVIPVGTPQHPRHGTVVEASTRSPMQKFAMCATASALW